MRAPSKCCQSSYPVVAAAGAELVRAAGFTDVRPLDWGESLILTAPGVELRVVALPAHHAHDQQLDHEIGRGNGYLLEFQDARGRLRAYWTGDAVLSDESRDLAAKYGAIDVLLPHLGGVGGDGALGLRTMNAAEAVQLTERVAPRLVLPIHHTTFGHYREPIVALQERAAEAGLAERFRFLHEGETFDVR
jgi:L-ascorbate metabolism protein UlaG (beta-lactamase superfamily)